MSIKELVWNKKMRTELYRFGFKFDRIESHDTAPGIPDDAFLHEPTGMSGWIEVKEEEVIPTKVKYRPKQVPWLLDHWRRGGICLTLVHVKARNYVIIIPGGDAQAASINLNDAMQQCPIACVDLDDENGWFKLSKEIIRIGRQKRRD